MAGLTLGYRQPLALPVDVVQGERGDLPPAQAVRDQQEQDRVVTSPRDGPSVNTGEDPVDVLPRDGPGDVRQPVDLWPADGGAQIAGEDALSVGVAQEDPHSARASPDRAL